ncbi:MAG: hypothetical protein WA609_14410 [Terriglobales bacterium]
MSEARQIKRQDITIDSNWITTIGMALLFAVLSFLLGWSVRDLLFDRVGLGVLVGLRHGLDTLTYVLGSVYSFVFAYSFPTKTLKLAFSLLGIKYTLLLILPYLHISAGALHSGEIALAIASQISYSIILFVIAQWFKNVVRRARPSDRALSDS